MYSNLKLEEFSGGERKRENKHITSLHNAEYRWIQYMCAWSRPITMLLLVCVNTNEDCKLFSVEQKRHLPVLAKRIQFGFFLPRWYSQLKSLDLKIRCFLPEQSISQNFHRIK